MAYLLGWKDILRPIRDGYRHLFPSPDTGPTPEERRKQRALDRLKGFTYFDTFEQLEAWSGSETDPLQRSNTPLLARSNKEKEDLGKANVLLCHDYAGNYHDYEATSSVGLDEEQYACEYLQYVDTFIYFSHKLVCVPPPTWTNTLHRNGVKALGTLLVEPQTPGPEKLLQQSDDGLSFPLATKLVEIAKIHGFDGWLVNIEKPFPTASWNAQILMAFLRQLKSELGADKQLIWYDALTITNKISYQNGLNERNLPFVEACGSVLTNYCWKESNATDSVHQALQSNLPPCQIYFGIDVWAQNTTKLAHPRITYPEYGGGGTNTGVAVAKLAELGLSAGIFAPGWTFEHFPGHGRDMESVVWDGEDLPDGIECSCGDCDRRHQPNKTTPVCSSAKMYNAGSETFFFTDFNRAFGTHSDEEEDVLFGGSIIHAQLGSQSVLPVRTGSHDLVGPLQHRIENVAGHSQLVVEARELPSSVLKLDGPQTGHSWSIPLFRLDMPIDGSLRLRISYRDLSKRPQGAFFYLKASCVATEEEARRSGYPIGYSHKIYGLTGPDYPGVDHLLDVELKIDNNYIPVNLRLEELGFFSRATNAGTGSRLAEIDYICIQPVAAYPIPSREFVYQGGVFQDISSRNRSTDTPTHHALFDIQKIICGEGETQHTRVSWKHTSSKPVDGMPYSEITGAFSHFVVIVDDLNLGRAYATEHTLPASFVDELAGREVAVLVHGIGFDGQELAGASLLVQF